MPSGVYKRTPEMRRSIAAARRKTLEEKAAEKSLDKGIEERRINGLHKIVAASCSGHATEQILKAVKDNRFDLASHWLAAKEAFNKVCDKD